MITKPVLEGLQRRGSLEIVAALAELSEEGANKTRLVYQANLNFKLLKDYLEVLTKQGILGFHGNKVWVTDKGRDFLHHFRKIQKLLRD